jgi:UDP-glucose 4-epimerase
MAEKYHLAYHKRYGLRATILRIGNPYGDRQHFSSGLYSLPGWFMNRAMNGETIEILSDGKQERDYIYIGDLTELMLRAAATEKTDGKIYNAGIGVKKTFGEMIKGIGKTVKKGVFVSAKKPQSQKHDSYFLDISALAKDLKWKPRTKLEDGLKKMHAFAKNIPSNIRIHHDTY